MDNRIPRPAKAVKLNWLLCAGLLVGMGASRTIPFSPGAARTAIDSIYSPSAVATPSGAGFKILSPVDNQIVPIGQNRVQIAAGTTTSDAVHSWRLFLDGNLIATVENGETGFTLPIGVSGPHVITATLLDAHDEDIASASVHVTAAPETPSSSPFNLPWVAPTMAILLLGILALLLVSLRITRKT